MSYETETAQIIIGAWINGQHLEDVKLIPVSRFPNPYDAIAKDIREKKRVPDLMRRHGAETIGEAITHYYPALYEPAVRQTLAAEMLATIPAQPSPEDLIKHAEKFARNWDTAPKPMDLAADYLDALGERSKQKPINTGIPALEDITYGIYPGQLTIIGARPSVGKSAFTLQVAYNVARSGHKVLFLPLEMTGAEIMDRLIMRGTGNIKAYELRKGSLSADQMQAVSATLDKIYQHRDRFKIYENVRDLEAIRQLIQSEHPDLIVIDQLSQIRTKDDRQTVRERYVEITRTLKAIALEEDTAIWLPCQMNRESSKLGAVSIDYLKESGSIEEDADIVLILSNEKDSDGETMKTPRGRIVNLQVAKNRQGPTADKIRLEFEAARFAFKSLIEDVDGFYETTNEGAY